MFDFSIDIHNHIVFDVDDGARDFDESKKMLETARRLGITTIVTTPHCCGRRFDYDKVKDHFAEVKAHADTLGLDLRLGFEVHVNSLIDFGLENVQRFCTEGTKQLLLEFSNAAPPVHEDHLITSLLQQGFEVIIAHPERYRVVQQSISRAEYWQALGCKLQVDGLSLLKGFLDKERKCAQALLKADLVDFIASDAHSAQDYEDYGLVMGKLKRERR